MNRDQYFDKKKQFAHTALKGKRDGVNHAPREFAGEHAGDHAQWARRQHELLEQRAKRELREYLRHPQG